MFTLPLLSGLGFGDSIFFLRSQFFHLFSSIIDLVPPQIMPFFLGDEPTNTGDSVGIQCMANKGDLPIDIRWVLNSSPIVSGENGITVVKLNQRTSSLNINSVEGTHRGTFKCIVSNQAGTAEHSAELQVNGSFRFNINAMNAKGELSLFFLHSTTI